MAEVSNDFKNGLAAGLSMGKVKVIVGQGGTSDYNDLSNKPSINGVELKGSLTSKDLHITGGGVGKIDSQDGTGEIFNGYNEEDKNIALSPYSHAEGYLTKIENGNQGAHVEGYQSEITSGGNDGAHVEGRSSIKSGGNNYSHAEGNSFINGGGNYDAHVEGNAQIENNSPHAHAEGYGKIGNNSPASHAEGNGKINIDYHPPSNYSTIVSAHAEGNAEASASYAHAEGYSLALNEYSHSEGYCTVAHGRFSHVEGYGQWMSDTSEYGAFGEGSHAEGKNTKAIGSYSHAEGNCTVAQGEYSHAEGLTTQANGKNSHAEGNYTQANKDYSHTEGNYTWANGESSHAEGDNAQANGESSHAEGNYTQAIGKSSHAQNFHTVAFADYSTAIGKYNLPDSNKTHVFEIGNGESESSRSNALTVDWDGNLKVSGTITDGNGNTLQKLLDRIKILEAALNITSEE